MANRKKSAKKKGAKKKASGSQKKKRSTKAGGGKSQEAEKASEATALEEGAELGAPAVEEAKEEQPREEDQQKSEESSLVLKGPSGAIRRVSTLQAYLAEVRNYPLIDRDQEVELAKRYREKKDPDAGRLLVTSNLRLVVKIALEYYRNWMDLLDLIQEGNLGLMQAVKKFDPYRGIRLSTYASFWIRAYILKFLMDNWRLVKIGTTQAQRKLFFNLKKEKERLEQFGFSPGPGMLAESLSVKESEVKEMDQRLTTREESMEEPVTEDGKQTREMVLPDSGPGVEEMVAQDEFASIVREKLQEFRKTLSGKDKSKEAFIFDRRLLSENPMTLAEVGDRFGISRERVRQLESRLIEQLKLYLKDNLPDFEDSDFVVE